MNASLYRDFAWLAQASYIAFNDAARSDRAAMAAQLNGPKEGESSGTVFALTQARAFTGAAPVPGYPTYAYLARQSLTPSGLAATIFRRETDGAAILSVRGLEPISNPIDLVSAAGIAVGSQAKQQIADAYRFFKQVTTPQGLAVTYTQAELAVLVQFNATFVTATLGGWAGPSDSGLQLSQDAGRPLYLTGLSLGGHVAEALGDLILRYSGIGSRLAQIVTFNSPGIGGNTTLVAPKTVSIYGEGGVELIAGWNGFTGIALPTVIENGIALVNHATELISDSLTIQASLRYCTRCKLDGFRPDLTN